MTKHARKFALLGGVAGLVLVAGVVVAPPVAPRASAALGCASFNGLNVSAPNYSASGVALNAGDKITATASPATTADMIFLSASLGLNFIFDDGPATTGLEFTAPASGTYSLGWSWSTATTAPTNLTWSFTSTCSSTGIAPSPSPSPTTHKNGKGKGRR